MVTARPLAASRLALADACPASHAQPWDHIETDAASEGRILHAFLADHLVRGRDAALARAPEGHREALADVDVGSLPASKPEQFAAEVAFAYDVDTAEAWEIGRCLPGSPTRESPRHMILIADVVGLADDGAGVAVVDYKRGGWRTTPARDNLQLQALALVAATVYQRQWASVGLSFIRPAGTFSPRPARLDAADLDAVDVKLQGIVKRVDVQAAKKAAGEPLDYHPGEHCGFCPAFMHCDYQRRLIRSVTLNPEREFEELAALIGPGDGSLTLDEVGQRFRRFRAFTAALGRWQDHLRKGFQEAIGDSEIDLGDGEMITRRPERHVPEEGGGDVVWQVLRNLGGEELAMAGTERHSSVSRLEAAARKIVGTDGKASEFPELRTQLDTLLRARGKKRITISAVAEELVDQVRMAGGLAIRRKLVITKKPRQLGEGGK